jgi:hypothetical protein
MDALVTDENVAAVASAMTPEASMSWSRAVLRAMLKLARSARV